MKEDRYADIICRRFCSFYKEGKEEFQCGTYLFLKERYSPDDILDSIHDILASPGFEKDKSIYELICGDCEFLVDGCDFREGLDSPPCGGYIIVEHLIRKGIMTAENAE